MCTSNHPVGTTYVSAPTKTVTAGGTTYAYRELGPKGGIPVVFLVHLAANLDNWDPASSTRSPGTVTSSRSTMSASVHHPGRFPTRSKRWQRTPTPSFRHSISTPSISSRSRWGGFIAQDLVLAHPGLVRKLVLTGTGPRGGKDIDKVAGLTYRDFLRATLVRADPKEFLFFNRNAAGKTAAKEFIQRLHERTVDRDKTVGIGILRTQLNAIKKYGRSAPSDLSRITATTLIVNGDHDRMVPTPLSEDLRRRIPGSELIIYPNSGHGGIFQYHNIFTPIVVDFLGH